jgi:hypothetical protein
VRESEDPGVERLPAKSSQCRDRPIGGWVARLKPGEAGTPPIDGIADQRMSYRSEMNPDLVCAPCFKPAFNERGKRVASEFGAAASENFGHPIPRDGMSLIRSLVIAADDRHFRPVAA